MRNKKQILFYTFLDINILTQIYLSSKINAYHVEKWYKNHSQSKILYEKYHINELLDSAERIVKTVYCE